MGKLKNEEYYKIIIATLIIMGLILEMIIIPGLFSDYYSALNLLIWIVIAIFSKNLENQHNNFKSSLTILLLKYITF